MADKKTMSIDQTLKEFDAQYKRKEIPEIKPGQTVAVYQRILEKGKVRTQVFEGIVIKVGRQKKGSAAITVRRVTSGIGVERIFFINSPLIEKIEVKKSAKVRRAKLYYMRKRAGKAATQKDEQTSEQTEIKSAAQTKKVISPRPAKASK